VSWSRGRERDLYREARRIALDHAPEVMLRAVELMRSKDERVATDAVARKDAFSRVPSFLARFLTN
jgi:hypothetical protein